MYKYRITIRSHYSTSASLTCDHIDDAMAWCKEILNEGMGIIDFDVFEASEDFREGYHSWHTSGNETHYRGYREDRPRYPVRYDS